MNAREKARYEKLRAKHGEVLTKLQASKDKIKSKGNVKSWMEVLVLVNEDRARFTRPVAEHLVHTGVSRSHNPLVHAGLIIPPDVKIAPISPQKSPRAAPVPVATVTPVLKAYEQLPVPQNPKLVLANDRKMYDNALDEQLQTEEIKLAVLKQAPNATNRQITVQQALVDQLLQQKEMVQLQQVQNKANRQKVQQNRPTAKPEKAVTTKPASLEDRLKSFFQENEPEALLDGRVEAVLMWTEERGEDKLNAMLREQYGRDLNGQLNVESTFVDQVQADRIARRLHGFYIAKGLAEVSQEECRRIGEWACKAGEAALNAKLRQKYHDDLDSYAQSIMLQVESKLRTFYQEKNPHVMQDRGIGPLLTWTVSNGIPALNNLLLEKYGEDLQGRKRDYGEEKSEHFPGGNKAAATRSIMYREMQREPSNAHIDNDDGDVVEQRKALLIKQLASFLEVNDPKRLTEGGLVPLVQWALPRTDKQVDELLLETYGTDLEDAGLRDLEFAPAEVAQWNYGSAAAMQQQQNDETTRDSMAYRASKVASVAMEDEFNRAEIRSLRADTWDDPLVANPQMFQDDEPDF